MVHMTFIFILSAVQHKCHFPLTHVFHIIHTSFSANHFYCKKYLRMIQLHKQQMQYKYIFLAAHACHSNAPRQMNSIHFFFTFTFFWWLAPSILGPAENTHTATHIQASRQPRQMELLHTLQIKKPQQKHMKYVVT